MTNSSFFFRKRARTRAFRFSVRTLLVLMLGVAIWLGFIANAANRQKSAVAGLRQAGIAVHYDYQVEALTRSELTFSEGHKARWLYPSNFTNQVPTHPNAPSWLRRMTGDEYFQVVSTVSIYDNFRTDLWTVEYRSYIDASLPHLKRLPHVKQVFLHQPRDHADSPIFTGAKELLKRELPQAEITVMGFVSVR